MAFKMKRKGFPMRSPMKQDETQLESTKTLSAKGKSREELDKLYNLPYEGLQIVNGKYTHGDKEVSIGDYKRMMKANMLAEAKAKS